MRNICGAVGEAVDIDYHHKLLSFPLIFRSFPMYIIMNYLGNVQNSWKYVQLFLLIHCTNVRPLQRRK